MQSKHQFLYEVALGLPVVFRSLKSIIKQIYLKDILIKIKCIFETLLIFNFMDLISKDKNFNLILLLYFVLLPFVFFSSILDPFLLARQLLTTIFLFFALFFLIQKKTIDYFRLDNSVLFFDGLRAGESH